LSGEDFVGLAFLIPAPLGALWASMSYVALSEGGSWPATDYRSSKAFRMICMAGAALIAPSLFMVGVAILWKSHRRRR
jgi:hypothetical protein